MKTGKKRKMKRRGREMERKKMGRGRRRRWGGEEEDGRLRERA